MSAALKPAFAELIPPHPPTLKALADRAIATAKAFRLADPEADEEEYANRDYMAVVARDEFLARLAEVLDADRFAELVGEGVLF